VTVGTDAGQDHDVSDPEETKRVVIRVVGPLLNDGCGMGKVALQVG